MLGKIRKVINHGLELIDQFIGSDVFAYIVLVIVLIHVLFILHWIFKDLILQSILVQ